MHFKNYVKRQKYQIIEKDEKIAFQYEIPYSLPAGELHEDIEERPPHPQIFTLYYVSRADMKRIQAMYDYLFEFQDVSNDEFFNMVKKMPEYTALLKRYPETSFDDTIYDLMEYGTKTFAEKINARQGMIFEKNNNGISL